MRTPSRPKPSPEQIALALTTIATALAWTAAEEEDEGAEACDSIREAQAEYDNQTEDEALSILEGESK